MLRLIVFQGKAPTTSLQHYFRSFTESTQLGWVSLLVSIRTCRSTIRPQGKEGGLRFRPTSSRKDARATGKAGKLSVVDSSRPSERGQPTRLGPVDFPSSAQQRAPKRSNNKIRSNLTGAGGRQRQRHTDTTEAGPEREGEQLFEPYDSRFGAQSHSNRHVTRRPNETTERRKTFARARVQCCASAEDPGRKDGDDMIPDTRRSNFAATSLVVCVWWYSSRDESTKTPLEPHPTPTFPPSFSLADDSKRILDSSFDIHRHNSFAMDETSMKRAHERPHLSWCPSLTLRSGR